MESTFAKILSALLLVGFTACAIHSVVSEPVTYQQGRPLFLGQHSDEWMHYHLLPTRDDVLEYLKVGRYGIPRWEDGVYTIHQFEELPGGPEFWIDHYGITEDEWQASANQS